MIFSRRRPNGFVLVAVIWILAALALLVAFIATQLEAMQNQSFAMEQKHLSTLDRVAIESTILYLATTRATSYGGLRTSPFEELSQGTLESLSSDVFSDRGDELRLDGRAYRVRGGHELRLRDAGSLISLRSDNLENLRRLLRAYSLGPADSDRLVSTLLDYTDRDQSPRLNGAERFEYDEVNLYPPTNRFLTSPWELHNVLGWSEYLDELPGFFNEVTIYVADRENYNTMSTRAMETIAELGSLEIERLVDHRSEGSFGSFREVQDVTGGVAERDPFSTAFVPSRYLRMRIMEPEHGKEHWIGITLTPDSNLTPWEIDYRIALNTTEASNVDDRIVEPQTPPTSLLQ